MSNDGRWFMIGDIAFLIDSRTTLLVVAKKIVCLAGNVVNIGIIPVADYDDRYVFISQFRKSGICTMPPAVVINYFLTVFQHQQSPSQAIIVNAGSFIAIRCEC